MKQPCLGFLWDMPVRVEPGQHDTWSIRLRQLVLLAGIASLFSVPARASDITWTNISGHFQWDTTTTNNWSSNIAWNNSKSDSAIFNSAGAGTINVTTTIVLRGMVFNANGYTIKGSTLSFSSGELW